MEMKDREMPLAMIPLVLVFIVLHMEFRGKHKLLLSGKEWNWCDSAKNSKWEVDAGFCGRVKRGDGCSVPVYILCACCERHKCSPKLFHTLSSGSPYGAASQ